MSKKLSVRECINQLDDIDADSVARARYEGEKVLLAYLNPRVALAYQKAVERAAARTKLAEGSTP